MSWILLAIAGLLEIVWATTMKASNGFTVLVPSIVTVVGIVASLSLLAVAMKELPAGPSYRVWTGIGAVGTFIAGVILHGEALNATRIAAAVLIVAGMTLMKLDT